MHDTVAFIDVGTNSIHMLVVRFYDGSMGTTVFQEKESVRMGKSLYESGVLDRPTLEKAGVVLSKFVQIAKSHSATEIIAMATCAAREAPNRADLVAVAEECGINLRIIPGKEEARLTRLGVAGPHCAGRTLCIDVGGGSTEVALALGNEDLYLDSLDLGAIRMAFGSGIDQRGKVSAKDYKTLRTLVSGQCYRSVDSIRKIGFDTAIGSSGTMEALAEACAARRGDCDGSYLLHTELKSLMKFLCDLTAEERAALPKVSPSRADIVIGGGAVVEELMDLLSIDRLEISKKGLREGMKVDFLLKHGHSDFDIRRSAVKALASRCGCDTSHEEAVRKYVAMIYREFVSVGILPSSDSMFELLDHAAQLHDVGVFISYDKHHVFSYTIIKNSYLAGFDRDELEKIAILARCHHGGFPRTDSKLFSCVGRKDVPELRKCAMILKTADILDRGRDGAVEDIRAEVLNGTLNLTVSHTTDLSMVKWKLKSVLDDFSDVFGVRINIEFLNVSACHRKQGNYARICRVYIVSREGNRGYAGIPSGNAEIGPKY